MDLWNILRINGINFRQLANDVKKISTCTFSNPLFNGQTGIYNALNNLNIPNIDVDPLDRRGFNEFVNNACDNPTMIYTSSFPYSEGVINTLTDKFVKLYASYSDGNTTYDLNNYSFSLNGVNSLWCVNPSFSIGGIINLNNLAIQVDSSYGTTTTDTNNNTAFISFNNIFESQNLNIKSYYYLFDLNINIYSQTSATKEMTITVSDSSQTSNQIRGYSKSIVYTNTVINYIYNYNHLLTNMINDVNCSYLKFSITHSNINTFTESYIQSAISNSSTISVSDNSSTSYTHKYYTTKESTHTITISNHTLLNLSNSYVHSIHMITSDTYNIYNIFCISNITEIIGNVNFYSISTFDFGSNWKTITSYELLTVNKIVNCINNSFNLPYLFNSIKYVESAYNSNSISKIPLNITYIESCFNSCNNLSDAILINDYSNINNAFNLCKSLTYLKIPYIRILSDICNDCVSISSVELDNVISMVKCFNLMRNTSGYKSLYVNCDNLTSISNCFNGTISNANTRRWLISNINCPNLASANNFMNLCSLLMLSRSLNYINYKKLIGISSCFNSCANIHSIILPNINRMYTCFNLISNPISDCSIDIMMLNNVSIISSCFEISNNTCIINYLINYYLRADYFRTPNVSTNLINLYLSSINTNYTITFNNYNHNNPNKITIYYIPKQKYYINYLELQTLQLAFTSATNQTPAQVDSNCLLYCINTLHQLPSHTTKYFICIRENTSNFNKTWYAFEPTASSSTQTFTHTNGNTTSSSYQLMTTAAFNDYEYFKFNTLQYLI